jgi:hypothetical protein
MSHEQEMLEEIRALIAKRPNNERLVIEAVATVFRGAVSIRSYNTVLIRLAFGLVGAEMAAEEAE